MADDLYCFAFKVARKPLGLMVDLRDQRSRPPVLRGCASPAAASATE